MEVRPGYKQTEVGVIPEDWEVKPLKSGEGITANDIDQFSPYPCYGGNGLRGFAQSYTHDGDYVLIGRQGALCGNVVGAKGKFFASEHAIVVTPFTKTDVDWLQFMFRKMNLNQYSESSAQPGLSVAKLLQLPLAVPPTKVEQEAIAEALSDADALIEALEQLIAKKRQIKQGAMQELLTGKRRLPGFSGAWEKMTFGAVAERIVGGGTPSRGVATYWNGDIPWMTVKDFAYQSRVGTIEYITKEGLKSSASNLISRNTLIIATRMALGKAVIFDVDVSINQDLKAVFPTKDTDPLFLYYWFQFNEARIAEMGSGSTVMGLSLGELKKIPFLKPPHTEQTAIATILNDMDAELAALEIKLAKARQLKQGMMQELLTGRIRLVPPAIAG